MSIFDPLFRHTQPNPSYSSEIFSRTTEITRKLSNYLSPQHKNSGFIVTSIDEAEHLDNILQDLSVPFIEPSQLTTRYQHIQSLTSSYSYSSYMDKRLNVVLFLWHDTSAGYESHILFDDETLYTHTTKETHIYTFPEFLAHPLYTALNELHLIRDMATNARRNSKTEYAIQTLSLQQDLVDYIIKLEAIGNDNEMFDALTRRSTEWQLAFFKPLSAINAYLHTIDTPNKEGAIESANHQLDSLIEWSSNPIDPIEQPTNPEKD